LPPPFHHIDFWNAVAIHGILMPGFRFRHWAEMGLI